MEIDALTRLICEAAVVDFSPEASAAAQHFDAVAQRTHCIFASRSKTWGGRAWDSSLSLEANIRLSLPALRRFVLAADRQAADNFVIEVVGPRYFQTLDHFGDTVRRVLKVISDDDPKAIHAMSSELAGQTGSGWMMSFAGLKLVVVTFCPLYPASHSRHMFGTNSTSCFLLLQSAKAFASVGDFSISEAEVRSTCAMGGLSARDKIRRSFQHAGCPFNINNLRCIVRPLDDFHGEEPRWWDTREYIIKQLQAPLNGRANLAARIVDMAGSGGPAIASSDEALCGCEEYEAYDSFDELGLHENLLRGIYSQGFEKPSRFEQIAIRPLMDGRDIIGSSPSGTGTTTAYVIGCLHRIDYSRRACQALVLTPTRELATAVRCVVLAVGAVNDVRCIAIVGGAAAPDDLAALEDGQHVVVGTPCRALDLIRQQGLPVNDLVTWVLDGADEMFAQGLGDQLFGLIEVLPESAQVCIFSRASLHTVHNFAAKVARDPLRIFLRWNELTLDGIRSFFIAVDKDEWKFDTLLDLYETLTMTQCICYCRAERLEWLQQQLESRAMTVSTVSTSMEQRERDVSMREFRSGGSRLLLVDEGSVRGVDVRAASLIIHFDFPRETQKYLERTGRSGKFGRRGLVVSLLCPEEAELARAVEVQYKYSIEEMPMDIADHF